MPKLGFGLHTILKMIGNFHEKFTFMKLWIFELGEILDQFQLNMSYRTQDMVILIHTTLFWRHFIELIILCEFL